MQTQHLISCVQTPRRCAQQEAIGVVMFILFVPTWIITRNVYFPLVIIRR